MRIILSIFALAAVLALPLLSPADAEAQQATDPCLSALVSLEQAKGIAGSFLREQGYGTRSTRLLRFGIRDAECLNGKWRVSLDLSHGRSRSQRAVVLVNCHTGAIEDA